MRDYYARNSERIRAQVSERRKRDVADPAKRAHLASLDKERMRKWRERNPERSRAIANARQKRLYAKDPIKARHAQYRYFYGITPEDFQAMLEKQGGVCAICAEPPPADTLLHVDHDHDTGAVRGLLCRGCNSGIGFFKDSERAMLKAIEYIRAAKAG